MAGKMIIVLVVLTVISIKPLFALCLLLRLINVGYYESYKKL